jgi:putative peptidoglycan lipid II flippase
MGLLRSTARVSAMTTLSRILGLVRDIVFLRLFGAVAGMDAFLVSFRIPNFMRRLFAEGAFSLAFVPVLSEYHSRRDEAEVKMLVDSVAGTLGGILFLVTLAGTLAAPLLVMVFAPGFIGEAQKFDLTVQMLRITFPYLLFISLVAFAGGVLNTYGRFGVPAFTPVILNLCLIGAAVWLAPLMAEPVVALAWGVFIAGVVQLVFQLPFLKGLRMLPRPRWRPHDEGVRRIRRLMLPAIFGSSVAQINLLFDTLIASFLVTGSVTWLYASDRLFEFPLGVFGIALATVVLPSLSRKHAENSTGDFSLTLDWALRWVLLIGLPATVGLFALAGPILTTLFQYGKFSHFDVVMASYSLMAYALGLLGAIYIKVLAQGFYARQNTRTPVRIGVIAMVTNMVLNVVFVFAMMKLKLPGLHAGLALATAVSSTLNAVLLFRMLRREIYTPLAGWSTLARQVLVASLVMGAALWWLSGDTADWRQWHWSERAARLALWVGVGAVLYFGLLRLQGVRLADYIRRKRV